MGKVNRLSLVVELHLTHRGTHMGFTPEFFDQTFEVIRSAAFESADLRRGKTGFVCWVK